jgi:hypothetical protein
VEAERMTHSADSMARAAGAMTREAGAVLGVHVRGERALTRAGRYVILPPAWLCRHVLVCGATGSGKTETVLRLAWTLAGATDARVYYLDGKGDRETAERFVGVMADAGRTARVFPNERFDGWRGEAHEIVSRLLEVVDYAREGPAAWYRDVARNVVLLACEHPEGPPRSSRMLLERMDLEDLRAAHGPSRGALRALRAQQVEQVRLRYEAFFGQMRGALDGRWAWEDADAAYVLLDSLRMHEETAGLWRFMVEDFTHYFSARKPREQLCVLILDELAALAGMRGIAGRVEQARSFNTALILVPQVLAGLGEEREVAQIVGNVETVLCHRLNTPEEAVALAGTRETTTFNTHFGRGGATGTGTASRRWEPKIDANEVRALPRGEAFAISRGRAERVRILRAPEVRGELPVELKDEELDNCKSDLRQGDEKCRQQAMDPTTTADSTAAPTTTADPAPALSPTAHPITTADPAAASTTTADPTTAPPEPPSPTTADPFQQTGRTREPGWLRTALP